MEILPSRRRRRERCITWRITFDGFSDRVREVFVGGVGVAHRDLNVLVTHESADCEDIDAVHHESGREGVAQVVPVKVLDGGVRENVEPPIAVLADIFEKSGADKEVEELEKLL